MIVSKSKLKEENEFLKELFNYNYNETPLEHLKEILSNLIKNSKNDSKYFFDLLEFYSLCRPYQQRVTRELIECVYSCFPEQLDEIQHTIKNTTFLKFIMFPEEFPIKGSKELKEMFLLLEKDDIDGFISFLSNNPTIDITQEQDLEEDGYYYYLFSSYISISLIDFSCLFGSLKCFKYLLLNKCEITEKTLQ